VIQWYVAPYTDNTEWYVALMLAAGVWGGVGVGHRIRIKYIIKMFIMPQEVHPNQHKHCTGLTSQIR